MSLFFFFKQKTAYEMRISDWSSDVCSSDLPQRVMRDRAHLARQRQFAENDGVGGHRPLAARRDPRRRDRAVRGRIGQPLAACDVQIDFRRPHLQPAAHLQHPPPHPHPPPVPPAAAAAPPPPPPPPHLPP